MFPQTGNPSPWASPGLFGPPQTGSGLPFNFGPDTFGNATPLVQFGASMISSQLTQKYGLQQMQFLPTQNIYDQMRAQQALQNQMTAMSTASASDRRQVESMMRGAYTMYTGEAPGVSQIAQMRAMSANTSGAVGMMTQLMGTSVVDQLFGKTGSAVAMANITQRAGQTLFDPVTGGLGFSGRSGGIVANEMFNQLYGRESSVGQMKGLTAGRAAELVEELGYKGMLGRNVGADPSRRNEFLNQLRSSPDMVQRLADQSESIQSIRQSGRQPTQDEMKSAVDSVQQSLKTAQSASDVLSVPGGGDLLRASQAQVLADKVKGMAGAVKAMEEIFGSEGKPNAPMREIVNRLNSLTQGGMAAMSGTQLESLVRRTQALSQSTGVQVESIQALAGHAAGLADKYNLPRSIIPEATLQSVAFAGGAKNFGGVAKNLDVGMSLDELTLADQQLRMSAAGAPGGADIAGVSRLVAEGALDIDGDSNASRMARAIRDGQTTFQNQQGRQQSLRMTRRERIAMLEAAGVDRDTAEAVISDVRGNAAYQNTDLGRKLQYEELSDRFNPVAEQAVKDQTKGLGLDSQKVGLDILKNMRGLSAEQINGSVEDFSKAAGGVVEQSLRDAMKAKGMSDDQINQKLTPEMVRNITLQMSGNINNQLRATGSGYKSLQNVLQLNSTAAFDAAAKVKSESEVDAQLRASLGGLATDGPLGRVAEALKTAKPGEGIGKLIAGVLNAVPKDERAKDKSTAAVMQLLEVLADAESNPIDQGDTEGRQLLKKQAAQDIKVLLEGASGEGTAAATGSARQAALANAAKAEKAGDAKTAARWRQRAEKLGAVQGVTEAVIGGEIKPSTFEQADGSRPGGLLEKAGWAAVELAEKIPGSGKFLQTAAGIRDAFAKDALKYTTGEKGKAADGALDSNGKRSGTSRIDGTLRLVGLDKALISAAMESDDDSFVHGGR